MFRFKFLLFVVITLAIFSPILADAKWSLTPRIYVEGLYDDNIFLTERNEQDDFITRVSPGVNLNYETPSGKVDLDYEFRRSFYNDFSELDYSAHHARAEARMDFVSWFGAGINEVFIRDEDPIELVEITEFESPSIRTGERDRYTRNIATPWATVRFGDDRSIRIEYRNHILRNDREDIADQDENAGNATFIFRFNIHNGIEIFYEHIDLEYSETVPLSDDIDHDGDEIRGRYTYYFNPRTSAFVEYRYWHRDFESESFFYFDYEVHNPTLGFTWDLYQNVTLSARGGYTVRNAEDRKDEEAFSGRGTFSVAYKSLLLELYGETGVDQDFLSAESLGFNEFWRAGVNGSYQLLQRLRLATFFYVEEEDFVDQGRTDKLWSIRGTMDYQILRWIFLSFYYEHHERDSNIPEESYKDNRFYGRITVQYDIAERFQ